MDMWLVLSKNEPGAPIGNVIGTLSSLLVEGPGVWRPCDGLDLEVPVGFDLHDHRGFRELLGLSFGPCLYHG